MFGKVNCIYLQGMEGTRILVEADVSDGLPSCAFVGYLASEVKESQDRVRTAIKNLNLSLPPKKITINLSPADFRKEGTGFDLAIAMAILEAYGYLPSEPFENSVFIGAGLYHFLFSCAVRCLSYQPLCNDTYLHDHCHNIFCCAGTRIPVTQQIL